ncbi:MAG: DUF6799 domain-containing protein [Bacteroidia bacterium]
MIKRTIAFSISVLFAASVTLAFSQDPVMPERYCAELKDGKMTMILDSKPVTAEVALNDGSKLTPGGLLIKKDGTVVALKTGDCVDKEGNINNTVSPQAPIRKKRDTDKKQ